MDVISVTIMVLVLLFVLIFSSKSIANKQSQRTPPLAKGAWPIVGHLPMLGGNPKSLIHQTLGAMGDKYGPIFSIRLGIRNVVVISNWKMAKECFTTNDLAVSSRPQNHLAIKYFSYDGAMFPFAPYGTVWRELRKISITELLSNHRLELLKHIRVSEIEASMLELYQKWLLETKGIGYALVDMKQVFADLSSNIIVRMVVGKRYYGSSSEGNEEAKRCRKALTRLFHLLGIFVAGDCIPILKWFDLGGHEKAMKETKKELDSIAQGWLDEHKQRRGHCGKDQREQDFMDVLLKHLDGTNLGGYDSDTIIKANALTLIAAGSDTTSLALTWALSLLLNNSKVLNKAYAELDTHIGKDRQVHQSDIPNLVYLKAIVSETLRLYPVVPLSGPRISIKDCSIGCYHIPAGTRLITNIYKIHRDAEVWMPDPLEFRPERFLTTNKAIDVAGKCFELMPFGAGRRSCPGVSLALQVVHLALANILHAFEFTTPDDAPIDMTESDGLANNKVMPLDALIKLRLPTKVYDQLAYNN